ncbi:hypothetical protein N9O78_03250, partial [Flavobacteriaceae bacterium]|nr:hypothetical protein [Flavobacteriaceae bacterium]
MQKKYKAINLSNVRSGGALQVALSFLLDIENYDLKEFDIIISAELKEELKIFKYENLSKLIVYNTNFLSLFSLNHFLFFKDYKFIFNLFGPFFSFNKAFQIS